MSAPLSERELSQPKGWVDPHPEALLSLEERAALFADRVGGLPVTPMALADRVLWLLRAAGAQGLTDGEGAALLGRADRLSFGRRRHELRVAGLVAPSELRRVDAVGPSIVWVAT